MTAAAAHAPAGLVPPDVRLSYDRTLPRTLAHRRQIGEMFVADYAARGDDVYLAFQVPRAHLLWSDRHPAYHDTFAAVEAARQAILVVVHRHLGVELGLPFTVQRIALRVDDPEAYRDDGAAPLEGALRLRVAERRRRGADVVGVTLDGAMEIGGRPALTMDADVAFMSRQDYDILRAFQRARKPLDATVRTEPVPLAPDRIGRENPRNVVVGTGGDGLLLAPDLRHPAFFDHEYDHVPGPLMAEGVRQAAVARAYETGALAAPYARVAAFTAAFVDFAEFEADLAYATELTGPDTAGRVSADVRLTQFGAPIIEAGLTLLPV